MNLLVCTASKGTVTLFHDGKEKVITDTTMESYTPTNVIRFGKKNLPTMYYMKNGRYDAELSEGRKRRLAQLNHLKIKSDAFNQVLTKIELKQLK